MQVEIKLHYYLRISSIFIFSESEVPAPIPADDADQLESQAIPEGEELNVIKEPTESGVVDGTNVEEVAPATGEIVSGEVEKPAEGETSAAPDEQPNEQHISGEVPAEGALPEGVLYNSFSRTLVAGDMFSYFCFH